MEVEALKRNADEFAQSLELDSERSSKQLLLELPVVISSLIDIEVDLSIHLDEQNEPVSPVLCLFIAKTWGYQSDCQLGQRRSTQSDDPEVLYEADR